MLDKGPTDKTILGNSRTGKEKKRRKKDKKKWIEVVTRLERKKETGRQVKQTLVGKLGMFRFSINVTKTELS